MIRIGGLRMDNLSIGRFAKLSEGAFTILVSTSASAIAVMDAYLSVECTSILMEKRDFLSAAMDVPAHLSGSNRASPSPIPTHKPRLQVKENVFLVSRACHRHFSCVFRVFASMSSACHRHFSRVFFLMAFHSSNQPFWSTSE